MADNITITDALSAAQDVATKDMGGVHHQLGVATPIILETGQFVDMVTYDSSYTIALDGTETHVIIAVDSEYSDMSIGVGAQQIGGSNTNLIPELFWVGPGGPRRSYAGGFGTDSSGDPKAVYAIPTTGYELLRFYSTSGVDNGGFHWARVCAPNLVQRDSPELYIWQAYYDGAVATSAASGEHVAPPCVHKAGAVFNYSPVKLLSVDVRWQMASGTAPEDFDLVFYPTFGDGAWSPNDPVDLLGAMFVWEFRGTPTAGQFKSIVGGTYSYGIVHGLSVPMKFGSDNGNIGAFAVVARESVANVNDIIVTPALEYN